MCPKEFAAKMSPIKCEKIRSKSDGCVCQLLAGSFEKYVLIFLNIPPFNKNISPCEYSSTWPTNQTAIFLLVNEPLRKGKGSKKINKQVLSFKIISRIDKLFCLTF